MLAPPTNTSIIDHKLCLCLNFVIVGSTESENFPPVKAGKKFL